MFDAVFDQNSLTFDINETWDILSEFCKDIYSDYMQTYMKQQNLQSS